MTNQKLFRISLFECTHIPTFVVLPIQHSLELIKPASKKVSACSGHRLRDGGVDGKIWAQGC